MIMQKRGDRYALIFALTLTPLAPLGWAKTAPLSRNGRGDWVTVHLATTYPDPP